MGPVFSQWSGIKLTISLPIKSDIKLDKISASSNIYICDRERGDDRVREREKERVIEESNVNKSWKY